MARTNNLSNFLTDVADAIRTKKGTSETILASDFDTEIENLPSGGSTFQPEFLSYHDCPDDILQDCINSDNVDYSNITDFSGMCSKYNNWTSNLTSLDVEALASATGITSINAMFAHRGNLAEIENLDKLDTSNVTNMSSVFSNCYKLDTFDISTWDTSNVTNMASMFAGVSANNTNKLNLDLTSFDVSNVGDFQYMFQNARIGSLDLSTWVLKSSGGINGSGIFQGNALTHIDIRGFDFSKFNSTNRMFNNLPSDCEIIVADQTQKDWMNSHFSTMTNVKTVAEYEAEQNT